MFWKSFLSHHDFWVRKCKNQLFEENKRSVCSFYRVQVQMIANKKTNLDVGFMRDFYYSCINNHRIYDLTKKYFKASFCFSILCIGQVYLIR